MDESDCLVEPVGTDVEPRLDASVDVIGGEAPSPATASKEPTGDSVNAWTLVRVCRRRSASVPAVTVFPRRMMLTLSASASTSERM